MTAINFKNLPLVPLVIGGVVTFMGCMLLLGIVYAVAVPPSNGVAEGRATATRRFVTATPIATMTPIPTDTPTATSTNLPTDVPTNTPVPPTRPAVTRVPATAEPPTNAPPPPKTIYGADLGLDKIGFNLSITTQGKGLTIPVFAKVHNATDHQIPFGYLGVGAHDSDGVSVAFRKFKINSLLEPNEYFAARDAIKIYRVGEFDVFFVICISPNDDICDQPGADYRQLADPIRVTITG
jgi:hypothetical protein